MEKKALSEKEKYLTILLCVVGTALALYIGICHYMGLFGKMEYFQHQLVIAAGSDVLFCPPLVSSQRICGISSCFLYIWDLSDTNKEKTVWNAYFMVVSFLVAEPAFYSRFRYGVGYDSDHWRNVCICKCSANDWKNAYPKSHMRSFRFGKRPGGIMQTEAWKGRVDLFLSPEKNIGCRCMAVLSVCGFRRDDCIFSGTKDRRYVVHHFISCYCSFCSQESMALRFDTVWLYPCS